ncbi:MAG: FecR domain-containing protein [Candidatus Rokubacteria bacterium]|nr:FecR domain-containing protein [Candidatus Rokubacteria bacterium]
MLRLRRPALALLVIVTLWPTLVFGQGPKAGVVTTLEGNVTVARVALAQPVALKFKDDVFLRDRITTGDRSLARLLLGGAAVVTVRERTVLTITEAPAKSIVNLDSGKIALAAARQRMRPGEQIEIRTPNAVAGIRGTVVVAEVTRAAAQLGGGVPSVVTTFYVLRGSIEAFQLDPSTGTPVGPPLQANGLQAITVAGGAAARLDDIPAGQIGQIESGLQPQAPSHTGAPNQEQVTAQAVTTAITLVNALLGSVPGTETGLLSAPQSPIEDIASPEVNAPPDVPITPLQGISAPPPPVDQSTGEEPTPGPTPVDAPEILIVQETRVLPAGQTLKTFSGTTTRTFVSPFAQIIDSTVMQLGTDDLILVPAGATVSLASALLDVTDSTLAPGANILNVLGSLSSTTAGALISLDPTVVTAPSDFVHVGAGGSLALAGPLLTDVGGTYDIAFDFVDVEGGVLTSTGTAALIQFQGSALTVGADGQNTYLFRVINAGASASLAGPLLDATDSDITVLGHALFEAFAAVFTGTGTGPLMDFQGGSLTLGSAADPNVNLVFVSNGAAATLAGGLLRATGTVLTPAPGAALISLRFGGALTVGGPLVELTGTTLNLGSQPLVDLDQGATLSVAGPMLEITGGSATLGTLIGTDGADNTVTLTGSLLELTDATVTLARVLGRPGVSTDTITYGLQAGEPLVRMTDSDLTLTDAAAPLVDLQDVVSTFAGVALIATNTSGTPKTLSVAETVLTLDGVALTGTDPQIQLGNMTVTGGASDTRLIDVLGPVTAAGPLLAATDSAIDVGQQVLHVHSTATLTVSGAGVGALLQFDGGSVTTGSELAVLHDGAVVSLDRPLLDAVGTTFVSGTSPAALDAFVAIDRGATLTASTTSALISLSGGSVTTQAGEHIVHIGGEPAGSIGPAVVTLSGGLLELAGGVTVSSGSGVLVGVSNGSRLTAGGPVLEMSGTTLSLTGAVVQLDGGSTLNITAGPAIRITDGALTLSAVISADGAGNTVTLTGSLLELTDATVTLERLVALAPAGTDTVTFDLAAGEALIRMTDSSLAVTDATTHLVDLRDVATFAGVALIATNPSATAQTLTVGQTVLSLGETSLTGTTPAIQLSGMTVTGTVAGGSSRLIDVFGVATAAGPLLTATGSVIDLGEQVLHLENDASLTVSGGGVGALLQFSGGSVSTGTNVAMLHPGAVLSLDRELISAAGTIFVVGTGTTSVDSFLEVNRGAILSASTTGALISLSGGSVTIEAGAPFVDVGGSPTVVTDPATVTLGGGLLALADGVAMSVDSGLLVSVTSGSSLTLGGPILDLTDTALTLTGPLVRLEGGSVLTTTGGPAFRVTGGTLTADALLSGDGSANALSLSGTLLELTNTMVTLSELMDLGGTDTLTLALGAGEPLIRLTSSALTLTESGAALVTLGGTGTPITQGGVGVIATGTTAAPSTLVLAGPLLVVDGVTLTDSNAQVQLTQTTVTSAGFDPLIQISGLPVTVAGPLVNATDSTITLGAFIDVCCSGASLTATSTQPLITLLRSPVTLTSDEILDIDSIGASVNLAGPLLLATDSVIVAGDELIDVSGTLTSTTSQPLVTLVRSGFTSLSGDVLEIGPGGVVTLAGPLLDATDSPITIDDELIDVSGTLTSTTIQPLVTLLRSSIASASDEVLGVNSGGTVTLAGPLLSATDSALTLNDDVIDVTQGSLTSTTAQPLLTLLRSTMIASESLLDIDAGAVPSLVTLAGPLLDATDSTLTLGGVIELNLAGATLTSTATGALVALLRSPVTTTGGGFLTIDGGTVTLAGPVLEATDSDLTIPGALVAALNGGSLSTGGATAPLVSLSGGAHAIGTASGSALFDLRGVTVAVDGDTGLTLGTDQPLQHGGVLLETSGATITTQQVLKLDTALLDASAAILNLTGGSTLTSSLSALDLVAQAHLASTGAELLRLDASTLNVLSGALVNVTGGSLLTVAGNFLTLANGATLTIADGALLNVTNGSSVTITGALVNFVGSGSTLDVTNALVPNVYMNGIPIFNPAATGAGTIAVSTTEPFVGLNANGNTIVINGVALANGATSGVTGSLIALDSGGMVQIGAGGGLGSTPDEALVTLVGTPLSTNTSLLTVSDGTVTLTGPLLSASDSPIEAGNQLIQIASTGTLISTTTSPLVTLLRSDVSGTNQFVISSGTVNMAGPLLDATDSAIDVGNQFIEITSPGALTSTSTSPLVTLLRSGITGSNPQFLKIDGGTLSLMGPLLSATDSDVTARNQFIDISNGGVLTTNGSTAPLVSITGGTHAISDSAGGVMVSLQGLATAVDAETGLTLGTDEPLQHGGVLFETSGATVTTRQFLKVDTALLAASAPLLNLKAGSAFTTSVDAIDLASKAKVASVGTELVKLDASTMSVLSGALVNVAGGSKLTATGNLLTLANGATLTISNGVLLNVTGGSFASVTGALVNFVGSGNTLNVSNSLVPNVYLNGIPIFKAGTTETVVVTNANPLAGLNTSGNTININGAALPTGATTGVTGSLIAVGGGGTVKVGP